MKKEIKRKKLTLSVSKGTNKPKKNIEITKTQTRNFTVIQKKSIRFGKQFNKQVKQPSTRLLSPTPQKKVTS